MHACINVTTARYMEKINCIPVLSIAFKVQDTTVKKCNA